MRLIHYELFYKYFYLMLLTDALISGLVFNKFMVIAPTKKL